MSSQNTLATAMPWQPHLVL